MSIEACFLFAVYTAGLFLHVGYSVNDQRVIEANTAVSFRADSVADKLGTLLNEDSAEQVCHLAATTERLIQSRIYLDILCLKV